MTTAHLAIVVAGGLVAFGGFFAFGGTNGALTALGTSFAGAVVLCAGVLDAMNRGH
jgi:hypothetical protein